MSCRLTRLILITQTVLCSFVINAQTLDVDKAIRLSKDDKFQEFINYVTPYERNIDSMKIHDQVKLIEHLAFAYSKTDQYKKSSESYLHAIDILEDAALDKELMRRYIDISKSIVHLPSGNFANQEAIPILQKCLTKINKNTNAYNADICELRALKAAIHFEMGEFETGFYEMDTVEQLSNSVPDSLQSKIQKRKLSTLVKGFTASQQPQKVINVSEQLLSIAKKEDDSITIVYYHSQLGIGYFQLSEYEKSERHLSNAIEYIIPLYGPESPRAIQGYNNLGVINMKLERYDVANQYYEKNKILIPKYFGEESARMGQLYFNLGVSNFQRAAYTKAKEYFKNSMAIRQATQGQNHLDVAHCMQLIGQCNQQTNNFEQADKWLQKSLDIRISKSNPNDPEITRLHTAIAANAIKLGQKEKGLSNLSKACTSLGYNEVKPFEFDSCLIPSLLLPIVRSYILFHAGEYEEQAKDADYFAAEKYIDIADSLHQYIKYHFDDPATRRQVLSDFNSIHGAKIFHYYQRYRTHPSEELIAKAFNTLEESNNSYLYELKTERGKTLDAPKEWIEEKRILQDSIASIKLAISNTTDRDQEEEHLRLINKLNNTNKSYYSLLEKIKKQAPKFYNAAFKFPTSSYEDFKDILASDETILCYYAGHIDAFVLKLSQNNNEFIRLCETDSVIPKISPFIEAIQERISVPELNKHGAELYSLLIQPLDLGDTRKVVITSNGALSLLPFEILYDDNKKEYIGKSFDISYRHSLTLKSKGPSQKVENILAMAPMTPGASESGWLRRDLNDIFRNEIDDLPGSKKEIEAIGELFDTKSFAGPDASETAFKKNAANMQVIHLATHGFVNHDNPNKSRLYFNAEKDTLEDGLLHAFEIVNLPLEAELVTLSACNTGVGRIEDGEGIASLGRAFTYAGCDNQLISLWPVNDRTTQQIMQLFYQNIHAGMGKSDALIDAKRKYMTQVPTEFKHPYYWAGFVYYGDNLPLNIKKRGNGLIKWSLGIACLLLALLIFRRIQRR